MHLCAYLYGFVTKYLPLHCVNFLLHQGNFATLNFYLTNFIDVPALQTAIRNIAYLGGWTNTTGALQLMRTDIFNVANGDRPDVPNVAILITDGNPNRDVDKLSGEIETLKRRGIRVIGIGVTNQVILIFCLNISCLSGRLYTVFPKKHSRHFRQ